MENALPDIPRLYTALAEWLSCFMFVELLGPRVKKAKLILFSAIYLITIMLFMELTATVVLWLWVPCMLAAFFAMVVFIWVCNKTTFIESIYYAVLSFSVAELIASVEWQFVNFLFGNIQKMPLVLEILVLVIVYGAGIVGIRQLFKLRLPSDKRLKIETKEWVTAIVIGIIVFAFSNAGFMMDTYPFYGQYSKEIANIRTLVDIAGVAILYAYFVSNCNNMAYQELAAIQSILRNHYAQYKQSRESIDVINMKYHDLKHQIQLLREMNDQEQRDAFLDRMEDDIRAYELQNKTGNVVLDTLLTGKRMYCAKHGITMTVVADGSLLSFIDAVDLCSIFGNALDNAIEAVLKSSDKEKRLIHVTVSQVKSFVMIRIENYYEGNLEFGEGDEPVTQKDRRFHGYGIKSIKYIVERYGGAVKISAQKQWFELKILIPYNL